MSILQSENQLSQFTHLLAAKIGPQRYQVWFDGQTRFQVRNEALEIHVADEFVGEWIGSNYGPKIREAAHEAFGSAMPVRFNVAPQLVGSDAPAAKAPAPVEMPQPVKVNKNAAAKPVPGVKIAIDKPLARPAPSADSTPPRDMNFGPIVGDPANPGMGLNRLAHEINEFVVGASNQLAVSTINYVCEFPGGQYDPLFLHAGCGLGKTHLLHGLCRRFAQLHPTKRWMYLTGEDFTNEYLQALRINRVDAFRRKMRDLDLLVIDDVQYLAGKRATQEEFLHTFNAIEATGRQIVLASDRHPRHIADFSESLVNRFISGMVVRIDPPNYTTRCELLGKLAQRRNLPLNAETIDWIAKRVTQNVRELEGALMRIEAVARVEKTSPSIGVVAQVLGDFDRTHHAPLRPESIVDAVCQYFGMEDHELRSGRRQRTVSLARSVAMFLIRKHSRLSFPEIASKLGKRNHSTVISACRRIERAIERNEMLSWESPVGDRNEEAQELIQRLEDHARSATV